MKKIILGLITVVLLSATPAHAQYYNRNGYYRGGGGWVAPFVGGAIVGGVLGGVLVSPRPMYVAPPRPMYVAPPQPMYVAPQNCWQEFAYYDPWNRPVYQTVCQ